MASAADANCGDRCTPGGRRRRCNIQSGKYLENVVSAAIEHLRVNRAGIGKKVDYEFGGMTTSAVGARYVDVNAIFVTAGARRADKIVFMECSSRARSA